MNPIALGLVLTIWQVDDGKYLDTIRAIPVIQHEQQSGSAPEIVQPPTVSIEFITQAGKSQLVRSKVKTQRQERYLVSEPWCVYCPTAKAKFLAEGGKPENVVSIAQAAAMGHNFRSVPAYFTKSVEVETEVVQPPSYRKQWPAVITLDGTSTPTKEAMIRHLRSGGPHADKHWQAWHLESWSKEQLVALHEDDHNGTVPVYGESETRVEAIVSGTAPAVEAIAEALSLHMTRDKVDQSLVSSSLLNIEIDTPDDARGWIADLLSRQSVEFPGAGVSASWGGDRTISVGKGKLRVSPGVDVAVRRFGVSVSTTLTGASFADDLSWVTLELKGAPDLTVRFK